jgi:hypothetical protein
VAMSVFVRIAMLLARRVTRSAATVTAACRVVVRFARNNKSALQVDLYVLLGQI